jgi:hypothetical protein
MSHEQPDDHFCELTVAARDATAAIIRQEAVAFTQTDSLRDRLLDVRSRSSDWF